MRIKCSPEESNFSDADSSETSSEVAASCVDYQTLGISRMRNPNISTEILGNLEPGKQDFVSSLDCDVVNPMKSYRITCGPEPKQPVFSDDSQVGLAELKASSLEFERKFSQPEMRKASLDTGEHFKKQEIIDESIRFLPRLESPGIDTVDGNLVGGNVVLGEFDIEEKKSVLPTIKDFSHCQDKTENNNEPECGDTESRNSWNKAEIKKGKPYALATLDGTIMLVQDEVILW